MTVKEEPPEDPLVSAVKDLGNDVVALKRQISINRTWRRVLSSLIAVNLVTVIVLVVFIVRLSHDEHMQQITRSQVLCPLYTVLVQQAQAPRQPGETDIAYAERLSLKKLMDGSYTALSCQPPLKSP